MQLPLWLLGTLMVGGGTALSISGLLLARRYASPASLREHHDVAGFILAIVGVIYAVLLAFVVLVVWERYNDASIVAEREANALVDVYRLAPGFSPKLQSRIRANVRAYATCVVQKEWPVMARGQSDDSTSHTLDKLWMVCLKTKVHDESESVLYSQAIDRMTDVSDNRRLRLLASTTGVPGLLWWVLILGGIATMLFTYYFGLEKLKTQVGMTALLAFVISLVLFLISALNYPFTGAIKIRPKAMETAILRFQTIDEHEMGEM